MNFPLAYERYMNVIGPVSNLMFYFQAFNVFSTQSAAVVSFPGFTLSFLGLSSWLIYGILIKNKPLIIANLIGSFGALLVLIGCLLFG